MYGKYKRTKCAAGSAFRGGKRSLGFAGRFPRGIMAVCLTVMLSAGCAEEADVMNEKEWLASDTDVNSDGSASGKDNQGGKEGQPEDSVAVSAAAVNVINAEELFTDRDFRSDYSSYESVAIILSEDSAQCESDSVSINDRTVTITEEGLYILSGTLQEGMIAVDAPEADKIWLVLAGASVSNSSNAAIYVKSADKVFVTLAEGSFNRLENGGSYTSLDGNNIDGVIFSKCDLTINGSGSLEIAAEAGHGIVTKDDLKVTGGSLTITAAGHGLSGKDSVCIAEGTVSIQSGKDGIHSEHDTNTEKGYVYIRDGEFVITAGGDGISAGKALQIDGGSFAIATGGGSGNRTIARDENGDNVSTKGIKGGEGVAVNGGVFVMDNQDDALHSNGYLTVQGGEFQIATGDDGFHADEDMSIAGGYIDISASYEGIEGNNVAISGGFVRLYASDDGINAAGGNDQSGFGGFFGRDSFGGGSDSSLLISGGTIYVNAEGDGVDSNGSLTVTGGELYISGPVSSADGAMDYEGRGEITGGIVIAVGHSGMAMNFGDTSTQGSALIMVPEQDAGTEIVVKDENGNVLASYTAESRFNSIVFSCPEMTLGGTYTVLAGENEQSIVLESLIYGSSFGGFGGGRGGFGGPGGRDGFGGPGSPEENGSGEGFEGPGGRGGFGGPGSPEENGSGEGFGDPGEIGNNGDFANPGRRGNDSGFGSPEEDGRVGGPEGGTPGGRDGFYDSPAENGAGESVDDKT